MTDHSKRTGAAVEAHYQFLAWLLPSIEKFPRSHKFSLGDRIETTALEVLEALIEATYAAGNCLSASHSFAGRQPRG